MLVVVADTPSRRRVELLGALGQAGREQSNAAIMFHTAVSARMGLGMTEEKTLDLLERHGPLSAGELAQHTGLTPASVTGLIDRLERKGFVRRLRHSGDGRRVLVEIDEKHIASFGALFAPFVERMGALYQTYTDEQLAVILDFMRRAARVQVESTAELTAET
jgi:DNA-binding MarR family transcriptional regulator